MFGKRDGSDFQNLHRNKRAITLNLKTEQGREILMRLAEQADVIVENMRPGVTKRLGVDFERSGSATRASSTAAFPASANTAPMRAALDRPGSAGHERHHVGDGLPGQGPLRVGVAVTDIMAGAFLAQGILIALLDREVSGKAAGCRPR